MKTNFKYCYYSDIDFRGYVQIECEEMCSIYYHPCCWKAIKEHNKDEQLGKKMDKVSFTILNFCVGFNLGLLVILSLL